MQPFDMDVTMQRCIARNFGQMLIVVSGSLHSLCLDANLHLRLTGNGNVTGA
jgi:hypothetical protein